MERSTIATKFRLTPSKPQLPRMERGGVSRGRGPVCLHCILTCKALSSAPNVFLQEGTQQPGTRRNGCVRRSGGSRVQRGSICTPAPAPPTQAPTPTTPVPGFVQCQAPGPASRPHRPSPVPGPPARPALGQRPRPRPQPPRSLGGDGERAEEAAPCQPAEGRFFFTCHVALQMMALPGSSGSPRPGLSPLTWGWGDRGRGWRRMAPEGGGDGDRGGREAARVERPAEWWLSLRGVPSRAPSPAVLAAAVATAAAATAATAAAAAGAGDSTFKMAPAGRPVTSLQGAERLWDGPRCVGHASFLPRSRPALPAETLRRALC